MNEEDISKYLKDITDYEIQEQIEEGGLGELRRCLEKGTNEEYVVKKSKGESKENIIFFLREIHICTIDHPTILQLQGWSAIDSLSIFFKKMKNGDLFNFIYCKKLSPDQKQILLYGISKGMEILHSNHIIDRDIKLDNILLDDHYFPVISDFNLSKFTFKNKQNSGIKGTIKYFAPEMRAGKLNYTDKVDIYSFGLVMYCIIANEYFENPDDLKMKLDSNEMFQKNEYAPFKDRIIQCIEDDEKKRPESAENSEFFEKNLLPGVNQNTFINYVNKLKNYQPTHNLIKLPENEEEFDQYFYDKGMIAKENNEPLKAANYFKIAMKLGNENSSSEFFDSLLSIGKYYESHKLIDKAIHYYNKAFCEGGNEEALVLLTKMMQKVKSDKNNNSLENDNHFEQVEVEADLNEAQKQEIAVKQGNENAQSLSVQSSNPQSLNAQSSNVQKNYYYYNDPCHKIMDHFNGIYNALIFHTNEVCFMPIIFKVGDIKKEGQITKVTIFDKYDLSRILEINGDLPDEQMEILQVNQWVVSEKVAIEMFLPFFSMKINVTQQEKDYFRIATPRELYEIGVFNPDNCVILNFQDIVKYDLIDNYINIIGTVVNSRKFTKDQKQYLNLRIIDNQSNQMTVTIYLYTNSNHILNFFYNDENIKKPIILINVLPKSFKGIISINANRNSGVFILDKRSQNYQSLLREYQNSIYNAENGKFYKNVFTIPTLLNRNCHQKIGETFIIEDKIKSISYASCRYIAIDRNKIEDFKQDNYKDIKIQNVHKESMMPSIRLQVELTDFAPNSFNIYVTNPESVKYILGFQNEYPPFNNPFYQALDVCDTFEEYIHKIKSIINSNINKWLGINIKALIRIYHTTTKNELVGYIEKIYNDESDVKKDLEIYDKFDLFNIIGQIYNSIYFNKNAADKGDNGKDILHYAIFLKEMGDEEEALKYFKKAADKRDNGNDILQYALFLKEMGDKEEALKYFKKAADKGDNGKDILQYAIFLEEIGDEKEALKYFKKAADHPSINTIAKYEYGVRRYNSPDGEEEGMLYITDAESWGNYKARHFLNAKREKERNYKMQANS